MPVTNYIWDVVSDNVLMEKDDDDETIARYVQEARLYGEAISQERGGQTRYYHYDGEGNTCELTDENENVTDTYEYSAFGEEVARAGTTENPFGYKGALGYYADSETNDIYVRVRTYEPTIGRWLSQDLLELVALGNLYVYVRNLPILLSDPSGLEPKHDKKPKVRENYKGCTPEEKAAWQPRPSPVSELGVDTTKRDHAAQMEQV